MGMAAKKERGRFSLRFNIGDPVQRAAVELLELQPPHSKSQYIANAITYYNANFADDPQPLKAMAPVIDRAAIEAIVREIMRQETGQTEKPAPASGVCRMEEGKTASTSSVSFTCWWTTISKKRSRCRTMRKCSTVLPRPFPTSSRSTD